MVMPQRVTIHFIYLCRILYTTIYFMQALFKFEIELRIVEIPTFKQENKNAVILAALLY